MGKKIISCLIISLTATAAMAADGVTDAEKSKVLHQLLSGVTSYKLEQNRSFFFATESNTVQLDVKNGDVSLSASASGKSANDQDETGIGIDLYRNGSDRTLKIEDLGSNQVRITSTEYLGGNYVVAAGTPPHSVFTTNEVTLAKMGDQVTVSSISTNYFDCKDSPGVTGCVFTLKASPEVKKSSVTARYVLSLGDAETSAMGKRVMKDLRDGREGGAGRCSVLNAQKLRCSWGLETDYTPDTASGEFAIKGGKVHKLLSTHLEPGC